MSSGVVDDDGLSSRQEVVQYFERVEALLDSGDWYDENFPDSSDDDDNDTAAAQDTGHATSRLAKQREQDREARRRAKAREVMVANVLDEASKALTRAACDMVCSRVLEKLATHCNAAQLGDMLSKLDIKVMDNRFGSHVVQTVLFSARPFISPAASAKTSRASDNTETSARAELVSQLTKLADIVAEEAPQYTTSQHASHVLRSLICLLAGIEFDQSVRSRNSKGYRRAFSQSVEGESKATTGGKQGRASSQTSSYEVPDECVDAFNKIADAILDSGVVENWVLDPVANPVLQVLLQALNKHDRSRCVTTCAELLGGIETAAIIIGADAEDGDEGAEAEATEDGMAASQLPDDPTKRLRKLLVHPVGSHLVERVIGLGSEELTHSIYVHGFRSRTVKLATNTVGSFVVGKLLDAVTKPDAAALIQELLPGLETLLAEEKVNVVNKVIQTCAKHHTLERELMRELLRTFHIEKPEDHKYVVPLVLSLSTLEIWKEMCGLAVESKSGDAETDAEHGGKTEEQVKDDDSSHTWMGKAPSLRPAQKWTLIGSQMLQALFELSPSEGRIVWHSLLSYDADELVNMAKSKYGSHAIEAFLTGSLVPQKQKRKLIMTLLPSFAHMAADRFGSHVADKCWIAADIKTKQKLADELLLKEKMLKDNTYGRFILRNCRIEHFRRRKAEWLQNLEASDRKRQMFADILGEDKPPETETEAQRNKEEGSDEENSGVEQMDQTPDERMQKLGFGVVQADEDAPTTVPDDSSSKKRKKGKKRKADDEGPKGENDEIDAIMDAKPKKKRRQSKYDREKVKRMLKRGEIEADVVQDGEVDAPATSGKKHKKKKKLASDLAMVIDSIEATKKKKGKGKGGKTASKKGKKK